MSSSHIKQEATATVTATSVAPTTEKAPTKGLMSTAGWQHFIFLFSVFGFFVKSILKRAFHCQKVQLADLPLSPISSTTVFVD